MNVLLTGGAGLVGRALVPLLRDTHSLTHFEVKDPGDGLPWQQGDLRDADAAEQACEGMDAVIHLAALHGRSWKEAGDQASFAVNVLGTHNILEGAVRQKVGRVIFTSSIWATGHGADTPYLPIDEMLPREPAELYGLSKVLGGRMCAYYAARHGLRVVILRPGYIRPGEKYRSGDPAYLTGAVDARDVAEAHRLALSAELDSLCEAFIITADSPLCQVDPSTYPRDPVAALEEACPGAQRAAAAGDLQLAPDAEWYTVAKARQVLGYQPKHNFTLAGGEQL